MQLYLDYNEDLWQQQVTKSAKMLNISIAEPINIYISKTLSASITQKTLFESVSGVNLLAALEQANANTTLINIANQSLILAGLFPKRAIKMSISIGYLIDTSALALYYAALATTEDKADQRLYTELSHNTLPIIDILMQTKENLSKNKTIDIETALNLYHTHKSKYAEQIIQQINPKTL